MRDGRDRVKCEKTEGRIQEIGVITQKQRFSCGSGFQPRSYDLNGFNDFYKLNDFCDFPFTAHCLPLTTFPLPS
jgi:hypothetical protein